jgi:hypothetical protein
MFSLQITAQSMCIEINMNRVALVARHQPVPVKLSEYYEPSMFCLCCEKLTVVFVIDSGLIVILVFVVIDCEMFICGKLRIVSLL